MTLEDLANHTSTDVEPISYTYRNQITLHECPPNGQGIAALIALGIVDTLQEQGKLDLDQLEHNSVEYLHVLMSVSLTPLQSRDFGLTRRRGLLASESIRMAFADTKAYNCDPENAYVPVKELLSKEYLQGRAALFDPTKANQLVQKVRRAR